MKNVSRNFLLWVVLMTLAASAVAQYPVFETPPIRVNSSSVGLQASLYPDYYRENSAITDMRWVDQNDSDMVAFINEVGPEILQSLTQLSGIDWIEPDLELYIVRYFPSMGGSDPLVLALGGMRRGQLIEAAPSGNSLKLNLIYQLSQRMLAQAEKSEDPFMRSLADHPLMRPGIFRRDNLALLLALVTSQQVLGLDSTYDAYQSAFWKQRTPGRQILEEYLLSEWILSPDRTLAQWVIEEPYTSRLVAATRPPRRSRDIPDSGPREYIEGLPVKGRLGFSVKWNAASRLEVDRIDIRRLGFAAGLREGDEIRSVDGVRVRNQKDMVEKMLAGLDQGGASVTIIREGQTQTIVLQPMAKLFDEEFYWEDDSGYYPDRLNDTIAQPPDGRESREDTTGGSEPRYGP